jgi:hypothetical protein
LLSLSFRVASNESIPAGLSCLLAPAQALWEESSGVLLSLNDFGYLIASLENSLTI